MLSGLRFLYERRFRPAIADFEIVRFAAKFIEKSIFTWLIFFEDNVRDKRFEIKNSFFNRIAKAIY
jgi:hypothetical protein